MIYLTIIQKAYLNTELHTQLEVTIVIFVFGIIALLIGYLFYRPYRNNKPKYGIHYGIKRENNWEYLRDFYTIISYYRAIGLLIMGLGALLLALLSLLIYLFE